MMRRSDDAQEANARDEGGAQDAADAQDAGSARGAIGSGGRKANGEASHGADDMDTLRWITRVAGRCVAETVLLLIIQVVLGASVVLNAAFLRDMVDSAVGGDPNGLVRAAVSFALLIAAQITLRAITRYLNERVRSTMENRFKSRLLSCLIVGDFAAVKNVHSGEWMNRLTSDTKVVADSFTQILPGFGGMVSKLVAALAMLVTIEPFFGIIVLVVGVVVIGVTGYFRRILKRLHKDIQEADGHTRVFMQERLESLLVIRAFAKERDTLVQAGLLMDDHKAARMRRNRFSNICNVLYGVAMRGAYVLAAVWSAWGIFNGTLSYGTFIAVLQLVSQVQAPLSDASGYVPRYYAMLASAERLRVVERLCTGAREADDLDAELLDVSSFKAFGLQDAAFSYAAMESALVDVGSFDTAAAEKAELDDTADDLDDAGESLDLDEDSDPDSSERADMHVTLEGLSLRVGRGDYVAFTGHSGCGKSTTLKLLMALYPLAAGTRFYEDAQGRHDLASYARGLFAYVPQGNMLMSGTIRETLAFGDSEAARNDELLHEALRIACADEFVRALDEGLDTSLGEHGAGLSEGQMQRISIARAVFTGRPVLLLDECTSALDEVTEAKLLENLRSLTDKTVLIVTHRRAALDIVDTVVNFTLEGIRVERHQQDTEAVRSLR